MSATDDYMAALAAEGAPAVTIALPSVGYGAGGAYNYQTPGNSLFENAGLNFGGINWLLLLGIGIILFTAIDSD